jgi:hypothetical protein
MDGRIVLNLISEKWGGGGGSMDWINLAHDRYTQQVLQAAVLNLQFP